MTFRVCFSVVFALVCWSGEAQTASSARDSRFEFREPGRVAYRLETPAASAFSAVPPPRWLRAWPEQGKTNPIQLGSRVVLRLSAPNSLSNLLAGSALKLDRSVTSNLFVLQAPDVLTAAREAQRLATLPGVELSHPVRRRPIGLHGRYAAKPNDPLYATQWYLEHRDTNTGATLGPDLNARAAWAFTRGAGVTIGISDDGIETGHPDLAANSSRADDFNFVSGSFSGLPVSTSQMHGTAVAGLAVAVGDNRRGIAGVAPAAKFASWVVFGLADEFASEEQVMDMFQYHTDVVSVQNHSWGNVGAEQLAAAALEQQGIANAVQHGRGGRGVVMVRAAGNNRTDDGFGGITLSDGNDDGYAQDPRAIAVGAVRVNGQVTSYSTPGANVLVATFGGDQGVDTPTGGTTNYPSTVTTDRQGSRGFVPGGDTPDYLTSDGLFDGTSGATPQISGLCALILAANPELTYRDVQQILIFSARQLDLADPDLRTNGAGFLVSHNVGFGVPDAGRAVGLARAWSNRPALASISVTNSQPTTIPDDGLRVIVSGPGVPANLASIPAFPSDGLHPDEPTAVLPLVDVGEARTSLTNHLGGQAALIKRGPNYFVQKIGFAAAAGARFVVLYNNVGRDQREFMNGADIHFSPIPAVFISQNAGDALRNYLQQTNNVQAQLRLDAARFSLSVTNTLLCEHVALRAQFSHPRRADVRLTLVSPAGTRSVLQHFNHDLNSPLTDWTYYSTHHFFESSAGVWRVEVSDERPGMTGQVLSLVLTIEGVPIKDQEHDGLDDDWEMAHFGSLAFGPTDDPDQDGYHNLREQILGTNPWTMDVPFAMDLSRWDTGLARLSWPSTTAFRYEVRAGANPAGPFTLATNLPGAFPETEWFTSHTNGMQQYFRVQALPLP